MEALLGYGKLKGAEASRLGKMELAGRCDNYRAGRPISIARRVFFNRSSYAL